MSTVLLDTRNVDRQAWREARRRGIGSSDAAAICGLDPYRSPLQVYMDKTGQLPDEEQNERMYWGERLEPVLAEEFCRRTSLHTRRRNAILVHRDHPWMLANVDRVIVGTPDGPGVLELKTTAAWHADEWRDDKVPLRYQVQVHHQLAVTGYAYGYIAVLIGGQEFRYQRIDRDEEVVRHLVEIERRFWEDHVMRGVPPDFDGSDASSRLLRVMYPEATDAQEIELPPAAQELVDGYLRAKAEEQRWAEARQEAENKLKALLGEREAGRVGRYRVIWANVQSTRLDTNALKADHPELYERYAQTVKYRRFSVKGGN